MGKYQEKKLPLWYVLQVKIHDVGFKRLTLKRSTPTQAIYDSWAEENRLPTPGKIRFSTCRYTQPKKKKGFTQHSLHYTAFVPCRRKISCLFFNSLDGGRPDFSGGASVGLTKHSQTYSVLLGEDVAGPHTVFCFPILVFAPATPKGWMLPNT